MTKENYQYVLHFKSSNNFKKNYVHIFCTASAFISSKIDKKVNYKFIHDFIDKEVIEETEKLLEINEKNINQNLANILEDVGLEYLKLNSPLLIAKYKLISVLSKIKFKNKIFKDNYVAIKNYKDLVDYIHSITENYPHVSANSNNYCIFINRINVYLLKILFFIKKPRNFFIFTSIRPWLDGLAKNKLNERNEILQILYMPTKINFLVSIMRLVNSFRSLFTKQKIVYLWPEEYKNKDLMNNILKDLIGLDFGYSHSHNLVRLTLISQKIKKLVNSIINNKYFKTLNSPIVLTELQSPVSIALSFLKPENIHLISHGSLSSYSQSFSNTLLVRTIGGANRISNNYFQSQNTHDLFEKLKINSKPLKPTALEISSIISSSCIKQDDEIIILHASTYKPFRTNRPGLFPTSTEYLKSIYELIKASEKYNKIRVLISFRDIGELSLKELKRFIEEKSLNCEINPKGKLFDQLLFESDIIYSHTSTCMEKALQINKPIICQKVKGSEHYFSSSIIKEYSLPIKLVNNQKDIINAIKSLTKINPSINSKYFPKEILSI